PKLYRSVIEDVINGVKDIFLDEGVDDQALQELRQIWEKKLVESKAIDPPEHPLPIAAVQHNARATAQPVTHHAAATTMLQHQTQHQQQQQQHQHQQQQQQQQVNAGNQLAAAQAIAHQLTIGPNGIVQPTVLQYHSTTTAGGKFTITLPAQTQHGMQTVMYPHQVRHSTPAQAAALALHPDVAASLLQGGMLSMTQAGAIQAAQRAAAGGMGNAGAVGGLQFHQVMKPMGDQQQHQYTVVTTGGQPVVTTTASPSTVTTVLAPPPSTTTSQPNQVIQLDGANDTSDEEEEEDEFQDNEEDKEDNDDDQADEDNEDEGDEEVEPLNSDDDVSDEEATENFEIDNVVVCQYDKISRSRNRWKFHFKDGIMNLQGKDYVFQKAVGDAEW
ncbi:transcription initiation factor IIA subunit 1 isoform X1, partial [Ixodes scapularis]